LGLSWPLPRRLSNHTARSPAARTNSHSLLKGFED
jgi:hypothetical protein